MSQEPIRICGFRKVGGIYIIGPQPGEGCDRLPYPIHNCPVCKSGIKFSRGFTWIDFNHYAHNHSSITDFEQNNCIDTIECPVCMPSQFPQPYGLLFVGREYTVQTFMDEARRLGISKRIPAKPRNLKPGSIVMLVHNDAALGLKNTNPYVLADEEIEDDVKQPVSHPGIFNAFPVLRIEKLLWRHEADEETLAKLTAQGITPVIIEDGDMDHDMSTSNDFSEEERNMRTLLDMKKLFKKE